MISFVYQWTNNINGKKYIGSHKGSLDDSYTGSGIAFKKAVEKYGISNFTRTILRVVDHDERFEAEKFFIEKYNAVESRDYYNMTSSCGGGWDHVNNDPVLRERNAERWKNLHKIYGHPKGMKGKKHPNMSPCHEASHKWLKENKCRAIEQWDLYGNYIKTFDSLAEAARSVNGSPSNIKYTADGKFKKSYNYKWKWKEDIN